MIQYFCRFSSIIGYSKISGIIPCAIQQILVTYLFYVVCWSHASNLSLLTSLPTLITINLFSMSESFLYIYLFVFFLDSTYKWYYTALVFVWLLSLNIVFSRSVYIAANVNISLFLWLSSWVNLFLLLSETLCFPQHYHIKETFIMIF